MVLPSGVREPVCGGFEYVFPNRETGVSQVKKAFFPVPGIRIPTVFQPSVSKIFNLSDMTRQADALKYLCDAFSHLEAEAFDLAQTHFIQWGVREEEGRGKAGTQAAASLQTQATALSDTLPITGWARFQSLCEGKWNPYHPRWVRIPAIRWMEKDSERQSHWFDLKPDEGLLGVETTAGEGGSSGDVPPHRAVYIVTQEAPENLAWIHHRMPVVVPFSAKWKQGAASAGRLLQAF